MGLDMLLVCKNRITGDRTEFAYWRKANMILNWFEHNLESIKNAEFDFEGKNQGEVYTPSSIESPGMAYNCAYYNVTKEEYHKLIDDCKKHIAIKDKPGIKAGDIPEQFRPRAGFFFGNQDINDEYWDCIQETIDMLDGKEPDWDNYTLEFYIWY